MPLPSNLPTPIDDSDTTKAPTTSFQEILERYQAITGLTKELIMAEIRSHDAANAPEEWEGFRQETEDHPELVYEVLATVIDIVAEAILELAKMLGESEGSSPAEQLDRLLQSVSDRGDDKEEQS